MIVLAGVVIAFGLQISLPQETAALPKGRSNATDAGVGVIHFDFTQPVAQVPHWAIEVYEDGSGRYDDLSNTEHASAATLQPIHIGASTRSRLIGGARAVRSEACESKARNIAKTGDKKIAYRWKTGDVWSRCTFNYSDDQKLNDAANAFQEIAETIQIGDKLKHDHRFDHLGLDAELDTLTAAARDRRAIELQNIAQILRSIVEDDDLMAVVRRKAQSLLQDASLHSSESAASDAGPVGPGLADPKTSPR